MAPASRKQARRLRLRFVALWPDLDDWMRLPLLDRVGHVRGQRPGTTVQRTSYEARRYLWYLALSGRLRLDYPWLLAIDNVPLRELTAHLDHDQGVVELKQGALRLGLHPSSVSSSLPWVAHRILLHAGLGHVREIRLDDVTAFREAIRSFGKRPDAGLFHALTAYGNAGPSRAWITRLHMFQLTLFHQGNLSEAPHKMMPRPAAAPWPQPAMQAAVDRWLSETRGTDRPGTRYGLRLALRRFVLWIAERHPEVKGFGALTRAHVAAFLDELAKAPLPKSRRVPSVATRRHHITALESFLRESAAMGWEDVPRHTVVSGRDKPPVLFRVPRFIPEDELTQLMVAIRALECPYRRAALLTARWSGARRGEIQRLEVDCLDRYQDGTARLRIPAGKTRRERMVPLHEEAAAALRAVVALRAGTGDRDQHDERTGAQVRFLFVERGRLLSTNYLFHAALQRACEAAGLVGPSGAALVTPHRFRHTVGTQLAERGAKLHTIMSVLGHESPAMAMVYARISDAEVLRDYRAVLGPGAVIAGPGAEAVRAGKLGTGVVDWLKTNFLKTELELGHCLRLPTEGPCECELFLTCSRFVTTPAYALRLRERRQLEMALAEDAGERGWPREIERHRCIAVRIERLLADMEAQR
jgi:integrase